MAITRERITFEKMLSIYCGGHHSEPICSECDELRSKLKEILASCPFGESKPLCSQCSANCVDPEMRQRVMDVMHYSGPRMLFRHPTLTMLHFLDMRKKEPPNSRG